MKFVNIDHNSERIWSVIKREPTVFISGVATNR